MERAMPQRKRNEVGSMTLRFHRKVYSRSALKKAVEAFEGIAKVKVGREGEYLTADISPLDPGDDEEEIAFEFANHCLGLTIEERGEG